jgi:hypothetical protein
MVAVTQIRHRHSDGRAYYDKKIAEGKTPKEALRCLKRRMSDAIYARLRADACNAASASAAAGGPGRATGERLCIQRGQLTPRTPALRTSHSRARNPAYDLPPAICLSKGNLARALDNRVLRGLDMAQFLVRDEALGAIRIRFHDRSACEIPMQFIVIHIGRSLESRDEVATGSGNSALWTCS